MLPGEAKRLRPIPGIGPQAIDSGKAAILAKCQPGCIIEVFAVIPRTAMRISISKMAW